MISLKLPADSQIKLMTMHGTHDWPTALRGPCARALSSTGYHTQENQLPRAPNATRLFKMTPFWKKKEEIHRNTSRIFIDNIHKTSNKWAVWQPASCTIEASDPSIPSPPTKLCLQVGDYGTVDPQRGYFVSAGNIFRDSIVPEARALRSYASDEVVVLTSAGARQSSAGPEATEVDTHTTVYKVAWP